VNRIWAFDHRGGRDLINEQVTLGHRRRKPAPAGLEAFRHPRIQVAPEVLEAAAQPQPTTWGRLDARGIRVPTEAELEALSRALGGDDGAYAAGAARYPAQRGGVYEILTAAERP
jgi:hypothetical protein